MTRTATRQRRIPIRLPDYPPDGLMDPASAAWVWEHVFTATMRQAAPGYFLHCQCQWGLSGTCKAGQHDKCAHRRLTYPPGDETTVTDMQFHVLAFPNRYRHPTPSVTGAHRMATAAVWLADRRCRWRCPCPCHSPSGDVAADAAGPAQLALVAMPAQPQHRPPRVPRPRTPVTVRRDQLDLFAAAADLLSEGEK